MKFRSLAFAAALATAPAPAVAQDFGSLLGPGPNNPITIFKDLFQAPALTPAEEARLQAAQQVADSILPPGVYGKMIEDAFAPMAGKIMALIETDNASRAAKLVEISPSNVQGLGQDKIDAIITLLDPRADERNKRIIDFAFDEVSAAMVKVEPFYRAGLARAYARHYDASQLAEINAFFATPTGSAFAAKSLAVHLDPQVLATFPDMLPVLVGHTAEAATRFFLAMDTIPQARKVDTLSSRERTRLLGLLGMSETQYQEAVEAEAFTFEWEEPAVEEAEDASGAYEYDPYDEGAAVEAVDESY